MCLMRQAQSDFGPVLGEFHRRKHSWEAESLHKIPSVQLTCTSRKGGRGGRGRERTREREREGGGGGCRSPDARRWGVRADHTSSVFLGYLTPQHHAESISGMDQPTQTVVPAATLKQKPQIKPAISPSHTILLHIPRTDPVTPGTWQGSHWSARFEVSGWTQSRKARFHVQMPSCQENTLSQENT